jgi:hypothetical protein
MDSFTASTGHRGLDTIIDRLRFGDSVVWQVDSLDDYRWVTQFFVTQALADSRDVHYIRFARHEPLINDPRVTEHQLDPSEGFESFATDIHLLVTSQGAGACYVFDSFTDLQDFWHSDLMIMNLFRVTSPWLHELDTIAYFTLIRNSHTFSTTAGIREVTELLLDLYHIGDQTYVHPLKVFGRYSPSMFFPHLLTDEDAEAITSSEESARLFSRMYGTIDPPEPWEKLVEQGARALSGSPEEQETAKELLLATVVGPEETRMVSLCRKYFTLADLLGIARREIGTGAIGGKSVGMLLAQAILQQDAEGRFASRMEPHDSFYLGSDLFFTYIIANGWWVDWTQQKTHEGYFPAGARLHEMLSQGEFPREIRERFMRLLEHFGWSPIIVRSSSLLEDNFGNAFAGKYESVFVANQGTPEERLRAFEDAVRTVYASAMSEEALRYRRNRRLTHLDEQMAVLVQRVSGDHHGDLFFPHAAGVGNSQNQYVWEPSIDPHAGMVRLVIGLGTMAVDRTQVDYPRIVTLDRPRRSQYTGDLATRYSQHNLDVINLRTNSLGRISLREALQMNIKADWSLFCSPDLATMRRLRELGRPVMPVPMVADFKKLLTDTDFAPLVRDMLRVLEEAYDYPVDVEFTVNWTGDEFKINVVQCRPLQTRGMGKSVNPPQVGSSEPCLLSMQGNFMGGSIRLPLEYVVLVKPDAYLRLREQDRYAVARQIGVLNKALKRTSYMLIGPGRWGTTTPSLGVPVHFTEITHASALVETTYTAGQFSPELSYGSHFFLDLVENGIFYAAVFEQDRRVRYDPSLVTDRPNLLAELDPEGGDLADVIHVAQFEDLVLYSDIVSQRLVCRPENV